MEKAAGEDWLNGMKGKINNFLWKRLPPETTLEEAEQIAVNLYQALEYHDGVIKERKQSSPGQG